MEGEIVAEVEEKVLLPQFQGEIEDALNFILKDLEISESLETVLKIFKTYSDKKISRQQIVDIVIASDFFNLKLSNGSIRIFKIKELFIFPKERSHR